MNVFQWLMLGTAAISFPVMAAEVKAAPATTVAKAEAQPKSVNLENMALTGFMPAQKVDFAPGEEMVFELRLNAPGQTVPQGQYFIQWNRTGDDGQKASGKEPVIDGKPIQIKTSLDRPGFVRILAFLVDAEGKRVISDYLQWGKKKQGPVVFDGGAGVKIGEIDAAAEEPKDFDAFWAKQKQRLAAVPIKAERKLVSPDGAKVEVYAVSVACAGSRPVTGYLTIPAGAKDKSMPAEVTFHGYGTGVQKAPVKGDGRKIRFDVNAHGYDLGKDKAYYDEFFKNIKSNGQIYAFDKIQNSDPEKAYFNGMALRVMRALEYVKTLPQWNGKDLRASGGSQGGLQTVWAAALDPDVNSADSQITWCCDFAGKTKGRLGGWCPGYVPALDYYDAVMHGRRISEKCKFQIGRAGLGDYTCPPSGVAALYNAVKGPKKIVWVQGSTHGYVPKDSQKFVMESK